MEKKSYISSAQILLILFIIRLIFATSYQSALNMGNCIQDILLSLPVNFITNFIIAVPFLVLLNRHPGHDPVECAGKVAGRGIGAIIAVIYYLFFIINAGVTAGNFENAFNDTAIPDVSHYVTGLMLMIVCIYGTIKGIEVIVRLGSITFVVYVLTFIIVFLTIMSQIDLDSLKPVLYKGTSYLISCSVINYNLSLQIIALAFLAPFMRKGRSLAKTYSEWNVLTIIMLFLIEFYIITVTGAYGAQQIYPLETLITLSQISFFKNLDSIDMVATILNTITAVSLYIYLAVSCLLKTGLNKHRRILALVSGVIVFFMAPYISDNFSTLQSVICSGFLSIGVTVFTFLIPLIILMIDIIKERTMQIAQSK